MKTKLLSICVAMFLATGIAGAQTKVWNFTTDTANWPVDQGGITVSPTVKDNLGLYANPPDASSPITNFAAITSSNASFPDTFTASSRLQLNGAGYTTANGFSATPTQRFIYLNVSGNCTVKVWYKTGSNGTVRKVFVTNGTSVVGEAATNTGSNADLAVVTANHTGGAATLYIFGDAACNLYKIEVTGASVTAPTLGTDDFKLTSSVNVFSNGKQINISNVISKTEVNVYSITGALIKSATTTSDLSFDSLNAGFYIVDVKSAEGRKSVKVALQ